MEHIGIFHFKKEIESTPQSLLDTHLDHLGVKAKPQPAELQTAEVMTEIFMFY